MNIDNLEAFIEVAERKSFSATAKSLKLSQPAVSKRIAALELHLSKKLFDRIGRSVQLTEAGRVLLPSALQVRSELYQIEDKISNLGNAVHGTLTICTTEYVGTRRLPAALRAFQEVYPDVAIDIQFGSVEEVLVAAESNFLEMAICPLHHSAFDKLPSKLKPSKIWSCDLKVAVANNSPLVNYQGISIADLIETTAILPSKNTSARKTIDDRLEMLGVTPKVSIETDNFDTMRCMASLGLGWACLPESELDDTVSILQVQDFRLPHSIVLIRHRELSLTRAAEAFLESLLLEGKL